MRIVVVLPAPFGPRNPKHSCRLMLNAIRSTATTWPYRLVRLVASTTGTPAGGLTRLPRLPPEELRARRGLGHGRSGGVDRDLQALFEFDGRLPPKQCPRQRDVRLADHRIVLRQRLVHQF